RGRSAIQFCSWRGWNHSDHPVCANKVATRHFLNGAASPPLEEGTRCTRSFLSLCFSLFLFPFMKKKDIHVAHSPDSDDAFMFYALATKKIDTGDLNYIHLLKDIENHNRHAMKGEYE